MVAVLSSLFVKQKRNARRARLKHQQEEEKIWKDKEVPTTKIEGAVSLDICCKMYATTFDQERIENEKVPNCAPHARQFLQVGEPVAGYLVNGPLGLPQFIPQMKVKIVKGKPEGYEVHEYGILMKNGEGKVVFYPYTKYKFTPDGYPEKLEEQYIKDFVEVGFDVFNVWVDQKVKLEKEEKVEKKKVNRNRIIAIVLLAILLIILVNGVIFYIYTLYAGGNSDSEDSASTTTTSAPTTTRAYPAMSATPRVPVAKLPPQAFDIVSAEFELNFKAVHPSITYSSTSITYQLAVTGPIDAIHLHCDVSEISFVLLNNVRTDSFKVDAQKQQMTVNLTKTVNSGNVTLLIIYSPTADAFEKVSTSCASKQCTVLVNQHLSLLVPHFDQSSKHPWIIRSKHPVDAKVLANGKKKIGMTSATATVFEATSPLFPSELSIVITGNLGATPSGPQVEILYPTETSVSEATDFAGTLKQAIAGNTPSSIFLDEMFSIVVVPAMESYRFVGRNVALVGSYLLRPNIANKLNFAWEWIFRTMIYKKVRESDKNPSWVYDQAAFFLSISSKSTNVDKWRKHMYGAMLDSGYNEMKPSANPSIVYEDQHIHADKFEHLAKVSTILGMLTSLGKTVFGDPIVILNAARDNTVSGMFFFAKADVKLDNGKVINVDKFTTCYIDSPEIPSFDIDRDSLTVQQTSEDQTDNCDFHLWFVTESGYKEHVSLSAGEKTIDVASKTPILLSGDSPSSAYGYMLAQTEFDGLINPTALAPYDNSTIYMLAANAFRAAFEGKLTYASLKQFMAIVVEKKKVTVDEAVDLWMWTVSQSRIDALTKLTESIVSSVLQATKGTSGFSKASDYIVARFDKSTTEGLKFEGEKALKLAQYCGDTCTSAILLKYHNSVQCLSSAFDCSVNGHVVEMHVASNIDIQNDQYEYQMYNHLFETCVGRVCRRPAIRGMLQSGNVTNLRDWMKSTTTLDITALDDRDVIIEYYKGLASNKLSKPLLFDFFLENWHLLHQKYSKYPSILGDMVDTVALTINTREQLIQFKQFIGFYGENLNMFKEFHNQALKAEKAVTWNEKYLEDFKKLFA